MWREQASINMEGTRETEAVAEEEDKNGIEE